MRCGQQSRGLRWKVMKNKGDREVDNKLSFILGFLAIESYLKFVRVVSL
jgi:hypothetical protein